MEIPWGFLANVNPAIIGDNGGNDEGGNDGGKWESTAAFVVKPSVIIVVPNNGREVSRKLRSVVIAHGRGESDGGKVNKILIVDEKTTQKLVKSSRVVICALAARSANIVLCTVA